MENNPKVAFIGVDCTDQSYTTICSSEGVTGFPTLRYFNYGKNTSYSEYNLEREEDDFIAFMTNPSAPKLDARRHWRQIPGNEAVVILETRTFEQDIMAQKGGALVMFYSPWCGHCVAMKPAFVKAAQKIRDLSSPCLVGAVDATVETQLASQHKITGFPTILYFSPAGDWVQYNGKRTEDDMVAFIVQREADLKRIQSEKALEEERRETEKRLKKENERKEVEEKRLKEAEELKLNAKKAEEKRLKEERQRKEVEEQNLKAKKAEEKRLKEERERKEAEEQNLKAKKAEEKRLKEERERKEAEEQRVKEKKPGERTDGDKSVTFTVLADFNTFTELVLTSPKTALIYAHNSNRKATTRSKLEKLLIKSDLTMLGIYEVDCALVSSICDRLNVVDVPTVFVYRNGVSAGSLTGNWGLDAFNQLLERSLRDEL